MTTPALEKSLEITAGLGTKECAKFRASVFAENQKFCLVLAGEYKKRARGFGYRIANTWLLKQHKALKIGQTGLVVGATDKQLKSYAENQAAALEKALQVAADKAGAVEGVGSMFFELCEEACEKAEIENPADKFEKPLEKRAQYLRLICQRWWLRKLRVINKRKTEQFARERGLVSRKAGIYCSNFGVAERLAQKTRNANFIDSMVVETVPKEGETPFSLALADAVAGSVSNPENRRNELMTRISGFEEIAKALGWVGMFVTITAPAAYHCVLSSGIRNGDYNGKTPKEAQNYLTDVWARIRAEWARNDIRPFGFRVAEPHHDGTPHWHLLLFVQPEKYALADSIAADYAREANAHELKNEQAAKARYYCKPLDIEKGSASGYIAKYISKNIDSFGVDVDFEDGNSAKANAVRVDAWASVWGIRQFQQIGGASVTVWRELRKGITQGAIILNDVSKEDLQVIAAAANAGDWAAFVDAMGGVLVQRKNHKIAAYSVLTDKRNDYGEFVSRVRGVLMRRTEQVIKTRLFEWVIKKAPLSGASWTCDNNYTQGEVIGRGAGLKIPDKNERPRLAAAG